MSWMTTAFDHPLQEIHTWSNHFVQKTFAANDKIYRAVKEYLEFSDHLQISPFCVVTNKVLELARTMILDLPPYLFHDIHFYSDALTGCIRAMAESANRQIHESQQHARRDSSLIATDWPDIMMLGSLVVFADSQMEDRWQSLTRIGQAWQWKVAGRERRDIFVGWESVPKCCSRSAERAIARLVRN
ncbi:unnamed protein product [Somion occarium]|uniref:Uncharacterized protein n=1 Tax=Somion occarium TaxID=3059160 RepID=A0ABP1CN20_9APHY